MYSVYILKDDEGNVYKGMTNNLSRRLAEHKRGKTRTTRRMQGLRLVYKEEYDNFKDARERELYFKTAAGRIFIKKLRV
jgi:predicted GIY-YIG superfamily endonuclease